MPVLAALIPVLFGILVGLFFAGASLLAEFIGRAVARWLPGALSSFVGGWAQDAGNFVRAQMAGTIDSLAAGMASFVTAPAGALDQMFSATSTTLWNFHTWIHNIIDSLIPAVRLFAEQWALYLYNQAIIDINNVDRYLSAYIQSVQMFLLQFVQASVSLLYLRIATVENILYNYIVATRLALQNYIAAVERSVTAHADDLYSKSTSYTRSVYIQLAAIIAGVAAALTAYITSVATWVTTTAIPVALEGYTVLIAGQIAVVMDFQWPFISRSLTLSAVRLALSVPLVSARIVAVPQEPAPGIAGGFEAVTGALGYLSAVTESVTTPLWTKLHEFADEESELGSPIFLAGILSFVTAAIVDPVGTADMTDTVVGEPLDGIAQLMVDAIEAL